MSLETIRTTNVAKQDLVRAVSLLLPGAKCSCCGSPCYVATSSKRLRDTGERAASYVCRSLNPSQRGDLPKCGNSYVRRHLLDALLVAFCTKLLGDPELLASLILGSVQRAAEVISPFPQLKQDDAMAKLQRQEARLIKMCQAR